MYASAGVCNPLVVAVDDGPTRKSLSTDSEAPIETVLETYGQRGSLKVAFRDPKQRLCFERFQV